MCVSVCNEEYSVISNIFVKILVLPVPTFLLWKFIFILHLTVVGRFKKHTMKLHIFKHMQIIINCHNDIKITFNANSDRLRCYTTRI